MALLAAIRDAARRQLSVGQSDTTQFTDAELLEFIGTVTADFSRIAPEESSDEITLRVDVAAETFTAVAGSWVTLVNKPIEPGSETVKQSGTTFVRGTAYDMDYLGGRIQTISGAGITDASATVAYKRSAIGFDVSGLTDLVHVLAVEYPLGEIPQAHGGFMRQGDVVFLTSKDGRSQGKVADKDSIRIYYTKEFTAPTASVNGSFARYLDAVMVKGVVAYALLMKAREQYIASIADHDSANTVLGNIATALTSYDTAIVVLTAATTGVYAKISTALDAWTVTDANSALDKVATHAGTDADAALDKITTHITDSSNSALHALEQIDGSPDQYALADADLDETRAELLTATRNADAYLNTGDGLINAVNLGVSAAELNARYAEAKIRIAEAFIGEASGRMNMADKYIAEARTYVEMALAFVAEAGQRNQMAQSFVAEATIRLGIERMYLDEAAQWTAKGQIAIQEAARWIDKTHTYIDEAAVYVQGAAERRQVADALHQDGLDRHADYWSTLLSRIHMQKRRSMSNVRQWADFTVGSTVPTGDEGT